MSFYHADGIIAPRDGIRQAVNRITRSNPVSAPSNVQCAKCRSPIQISDADLQSDAIRLRVCAPFPVAINEYVVTLEFSVTADRTRTNDNPEIRVP
jgi:hypothetical protein